MYSCNHMYYFLHDSDCDMAKYFMSRLINFYELESKNDA